MQSRLLLSVFMLFISLILSVSAYAAEQYQVVRVESWDTLNMRASPGTKNPVMAKLPHNAAGIALLGGRKKVGRTQWVEVSWQGQRGWVSLAYLKKQANTSVPAVNILQPPAQQPSAQTNSDKQNSVSLMERKPVIRKKQKGMWILECGSASPFWKVEVLPEWIRGSLGAHKTGMPITHKRQKHGKYHKVAIETEVRGSNKWNRLRMTLNYTKSCHSSLLKRKVPFVVEGLFNNKPISGCCRSIQVK